jgi:hypothetical protein
MATKREELEKLARGEGCLGKAADDEPIFILRSQDLLAPDLVRNWSRRASRHLGETHEKVIEAQELAMHMEDWADRTNRGKMPD